MEKTFSIYRPEAFRTYSLAAFSCILAIVLLILKCANSYRTKLAVPVGRRLSDGRRPPAHEDSGLCSPEEGSNLPSTSSAPTQSPEDESTEPPAKRPKLDSEPTKGGMRQSVSKWVGSSSGGDSGTPEDPSRQRHPPTMTESPGVFPGFSQEELSAAAALLQLQTQVQQLQPPQEERRQDDQQLWQQVTTPTTLQETASTEHSGYFVTHSSHTTLGVLRLVLQPGTPSGSGPLATPPQDPEEGAQQAAPGFLPQPEEPSTGILRIHLPETGGGAGHPQASASAAGVTVSSSVASSASISPSPVGRQPGIQPSQIGSPQDVQELRQQSPTPSTSAAIAASQSSGAAGPSTSSAPPISDQPSTSSAPSQVPAPTGERRLHPFLRLPKTPPFRPRRPFSPSAALLDVFAMAPLFPLFEQMRELLGKDELTVDDLGKLTCVTERMVSLGMWYHKKDISQRAPYSVAAHFGQRFLMLFYVVSALELIGESTTASWWQTFTEAIPHNYTPTTQTPSGAPYKTFLSMLISDLSSAIGILKQGKRPANPVVVDLMRRLFCMQRSPRSFRDPQ